MAINLGFIPDGLVVHLTRGRGQRFGLQSSEVFAVGTVVELVFYPPSGSPITWEATVSGPGVTWDITATEVDTVLDAGADTVYLDHTEPGEVTDPWGKGYVHAH